MGAGFAASGSFCIEGNNNAAIVVDRGLPVMLASCRGWNRAARRRSQPGSALTALAQDLMRIPSVTGSAEESELQHDVARRLEALDGDVDLWPVNLDETLNHPDFPGLEVERNEAWGLVAGFGSGEGPTVILNGHIDVVPSGDPELWRGLRLSGAARVKYSDRLETAAVRRRRPMLEPRHPHMPDPGIAGPTVERQRLSGCPFDVLSAREQSRQDPPQESRPWAFSTNSRRDCTVPAFMWN